jgi:hypothetical protein
VSKPITIYGPKGIGEFLAGFERSFAINEAIRRKDFPDFYKIDPKDLFQRVEIEAPPKRGVMIYKDQNVEVDAIENCHYHFASDAAIVGGTSFAFRFKTDDKTIVLSGDTGPCDALAEFARGADILVHEVINVDLVLASLTGAGVVPPERISYIRRHIFDHDLSRPPFFFGLPDVLDGVRFRLAVVVTLETWLWNLAMSQAAAGPGGVSAR